MPTAPAVTVIIPTYNWSAALRLSIGSVLSQTHTDFELLVIGDCCTDDSESVVRSFGDPRVSWYNLPTRHRTQSGPNNYGLGIGAADLIAYLGHDDIWHPDHLSALVATMRETDAEMACGVTVMYGPSGSGIRLVSGLFVEGRVRSEDCVPPSSLMHRRSLIETIGPWGSPEELAAPVDADLLQRAYRAGVRLVSTERLTVFKFNAAFRRDSYLRRETTDQQQMLDRLRADPQRCVEQEWAGVMRARREFRLHDHFIRENWGVPAGFIHRTNLRARGLDDGSVSELSRIERFELDDQFSAMEWYHPETSDEWGSYRWSGPSPVATLALPVRVTKPFCVRIQVLTGFGADIENEITLQVDGNDAEFTVVSSSGPAVCLQTGCIVPQAPTGPLRLRIRTDRLRCPYFESDGRSEDRRWLGVCVNWVEVEPLDHDSHAVLSIECGIC